MNEYSVAMKWISVKDKMSKQTEDVLLYDWRLNAIGFGFFNDDFWMWLPGIYAIPVANGWISHWMYVPDLSFGGWINVDEKRPISKEQVLLFNKWLNSASIGWLLPDGHWRWALSNRVIPLGLSQNDRISHWMPLPDPPSI